MTKMNKTQQEIHDWIEKAICEKYPDKADLLTGDISFSAMGMDSLSHVQLIASLEEWLGKSIDPTMAYNYPTISSLSKKIAEIYSESEQESATPITCIVIGAGQSGISVAKRLGDEDVDYLVIDKADCIGDVWKKRPDNLKLFTSRRFCGLEGLPCPGEPDGYPGKDEIADYLAQYVNTFKLNVLLGRTVVEVVKINEKFKVTLDNDRVFISDVIINATGSNQVPVIPDCAGDLTLHIQQLTAASYKFPMQVLPGKVAVIGDGASGRQIADELSDSHEVILSVGKKRKLLPNKLLGKDIFWWMDKLGFLKRDKYSLVGKIIQKRNPIPCGELSNTNLTSKGIDIVSRLEMVDGEKLVFANGQSREVGSVIWCMGYKDNTSWLKIPECVGDEGFIEQYGKTPQPGMYVIGRKWLRNRASELIMGADSDALHIVRNVLEYLGKEQIKDLSYGNIESVHS